LAIVKQLVELHGGTIWATSAGEGMGASFIIHLPALVPDPDGQEHRGRRRLSSPPASGPTRANLCGLKVLVVDDQRDARELIRRLLSESGAQVVTAESAIEALPLLNDSAPDVLISDIGMAEVDGYEFLRQVRKSRSAAGARIPAIALTAFARSEDRTRALRAGYIAHVAKPVEPSEFLATIAVVAGRVEEHA
jgi:CheY-like chemotaxis protein